MGKKSEMVAYAYVVHIAIVMMQSIVYNRAIWESNTFPAVSAGFKVIMVGRMCYI